MSGEKISILLVDDDDIDVRAIRRAFKDQRLSNPIVRAVDGVDALSILRGECKEKVVGRPFMVLLDINMPRMDGLQFLEELRADPGLSDSVVFVLTTSDDERDKASAYSKNISGYLVKSRAAEDFLEHAKMLKQFLFSVEFPPTLK